MHNFTDSYKMKGMRKRLVEVLQNKGIEDQAVLNAIDNVPRHVFLDEAFAEWAYKDQAFPISANQTISQPYTVAFQTQLLNLSFEDNVLEIGTGSGYQASILGQLLKRVYTIERHKILFEESSSLLKELKYFNIRTKFGDGYKGWPSKAPFDKILLTAGSQTLPIDLCNQLKIGGQIVIPIGDEKEQQMFRFTKMQDLSFKKEVFGSFKFVPFLGGKSYHGKAMIKQNPNAARVQL